MDGIRRRLDGHHLPVPLDPRIYFSFSFIFFYFLEIPVATRSPFSLGLQVSSELADIGGMALGVDCIFT